MSLNWLNPILKKWTNLVGSGNEFDSDAETDLHLSNYHHTRALKGLSAEGNNGTDAAGPPDVFEDSLAEQSSPWMKRKGFKEEFFRLRHNFMTAEKISIVAATWNVAGFPPHPDLVLEEWLHQDDHQQPDIYVIGFQEVVPLTTNSLLAADYEQAGKLWNDLLRKTINHRRLRKSISTSSTIESDQDLAPDSSPADESFDSDLTPASVASSMPNLNLASQQSEQYSIVASKQMVGIHLVVWVKDSLKTKVRNVKVTCVPFGLMRVLGNKGSIVASLSVYDSSFCFICSHLSSGEKDLEAQRRVQDCEETLKRATFTWTEEATNHSIKKLPKTIVDHDQIVWIGDLNFRLDMAYETVRAHLQVPDFSSLLEHDQLKAHLQVGGVLEGWQEGPITFPPTYKYIVNTQSYVGESNDDLASRRIPAWCDRILFRGEGMAVEHYDHCQGLLSSDHRPVAARLSTRLHKWTPPSWRNAIKMVRSRLDAEELRLKPQHSLATNTVSFGKVRYGEEVVLQVSLSNTGEVPFTFSIHRPLEHSGNVQKWLWYEPRASTTVQPGREVEILLTASISGMHVDVDALMASNPRQLSSILIIRIENSGDFFLSADAEYIPSCWGASLELLSRVATPIQQWTFVPPSDSDDSLAESQQLETPKELTRLLSFLRSSCSTSSPCNLFTASRFGIEIRNLQNNAHVAQHGHFDWSIPEPVSRSKVVNWPMPDPKLDSDASSVRDSLDSGTDFLPETSAQTISQILILFLRALPSPLISKQLTKVIDSIHLWPMDSRVASDLLTENSSALSAMATRELISLLQQLQKGSQQDDARCEDAIAVFVSAMFPQESFVPWISFRRRMNFIRDLSIDV